ncbi:MAG: DUF1460 domain-containing protein [Bacteroidaceae bacterium]|nr:DUF1460 domain-containing protein [Bacteroidaceae bacterium]
MKHLFIALSLLLACAFNANAAVADSVVYHHEATDTAAIVKILDATRKAELETPADRLAFIARQLLGSPYVAATLEGDTEVLRINMSEFDCTTLVETAIALSLTAAVDTASYNEFAHNLRNIRYRDGVVDGYASRLHYVSDWIADNTRRGNFVEVTAQCPLAKRDTKSINYISTHSRNYTDLLNNDSLVNCIKEVEAKYNNYRYQYIPATSLNSEALAKWFNNGDIVLFTTSAKGLDVSHMGIIVVERNRVRLLHASSNSHTVMLDNQPLYNYVMSNRSINGIRIVRL